MALRKKCCEHGTVDKWLTAPRTYWVAIGLLTLLWAQAQLTAVYVPKYQEPLSTSSGPVCLWADGTWTYPMNFGIGWGPHAACPPMRIRVAK